MESTSRANALAYRLLLAGLSVALPIALLLGVAELGVRIARGELFRTPQPGARGLGLHVVDSRYPAVWDAELGYVPRPGAQGRENPWNTEVTIDPNGVRSNGPGPRPSGPPILIVGDSTTFGDEVSDAETWPAQLEAMLGRPVVNGGVFGYGLDQAVLRAEALLETIPAETLIVSALPEIILRCEFAYRYAWKPYFDIVDGALVLRNVPVPPSDQRPSEGPAWRRSLRWSHLADSLFARLDPDGWLVPDTIRAHRQGVDVARLLVDRLADLARDRSLSLLFVLQYVPSTPMPPKRALVERARLRGVPVVDVAPAFETEIGRAGSSRGLFRVHQRKDGSTIAGHANREGNRLTASLVAAKLRAIGDG